MVATDPCRCPSCGQPNACATANRPATAVAAAPCWCSAVAVPGPLHAHLLEAFPPDACLCRGCLTAAADLPTGLAWTTDPGGRPAVRLRSGDDDVLVSTTGAQLLSWHHRGQDVLWTASSPEYATRKPVRGGVPIVFPWFGDHPTDPRGAAHGFVRNLPWRFVGAGPGPRVAFAVGDDATTRTLWPHAFALRATFALDRGLSIAITITNPSAEPWPAELALHTYFAVGDVHTATVHGLAGVPCTEHAKEPEPSWDRSAPIGFRAETDRVFQGTPPEIELRTPALRRAVRLHSPAARSAIVWNPWPTKTARLSQMRADDWRRFVCIETANVKENRMLLPPGGTATLTLQLTTATLG